MYIWQVLHFFHVQNNWRIHVLCCIPCIIITTSYSEQPWVVTQVPCACASCSACLILSVSQSSQPDVANSPARGSGDRDIELLRVPPISMFSRRSLPELKCTCSLGSPAGSAWRHECSLAESLEEHKESCAVRRRSQMVSVPNIRTSTESDGVVLPGSMQLRHRFSSSNSSTDVPPKGHCRSAGGLDTSKRKYLDLPLQTCTYERSASCEEPIQSVSTGATADFSPTPCVSVIAPHSSVLPPRGESVNGDNKLASVDSDVFRGDTEQDDAPWPPHASYYPISTDGSLDLQCSVQCTPPPRRCVSSDTPQLHIRCSSSSLDTHSLQCATDNGDTSLVTLDIPDDDDDGARCIACPQRLSRTFDDDTPTLIILGEMPSTNGNGHVKDAEDIVWQPPRLPETNCWL